LFWWFWFRLTKGRKAAADWMDLGRRHGYAVDRPDAPVFHDEPLRHNDKLVLKNLPALRRVLAAIPEGSRLGVAQIGHIGNEDIWFEVAAALARKNVIVHDCLSDRLFDLATDSAAVPEGARLVRLQAAQARTEAARRASVSRTKGRTVLFGQTLRRAMVEWGKDDDRSAERVAADVGVGVATMYRMMVDERGDRVGRIAAIALTKQGLWPPPRPGRD